MKKFLFIAVFLISAVTIFGQSTRNLGSVQTAYSTYGLASDTATNTGDVWVGIGYTSSYNTFKDGLILAVQPVTTQITGTIAGTVYLQGSVNGSNWDNIDSTNCGCVDLVYTADYDITATNAGTWLWVVKTLYPYYRVFYDGSGTHTSTLTATYFLLKQED